MKIITCDICGKQKQPFDYDNDIIEDVKILSDLKYDICRECCDIMVNNKIRHNLEEEYFNKLDNVKKEYDNKVKEKVLEIKNNKED